MTLNHLSPPADRLHAAATLLRNPARHNLQPSLGVVLADLLRVHANLWEAQQAVAGDEPFEAFAATELLAVADAILGIPAAKALAEQHAVTR